MICVYLFDSIFSEANESSSACEPGIELHVETNTPPNRGFKILEKVERSRQGAAVVSARRGVNTASRMLSGRSYNRNGGGNTAATEFSKTLYCRNLIT